MVLCKFWAQGNCRKGNACTFEHPTNNRQQNSGNTSSGGFRGGSFGSVGARPERWQLNEADIESDLTTTRPKWILSAYGPGKETPAALFVENEYSPEEVRWRYYQQQAVGNGDAADREAQQLWQKAENDMLTVSRNVKDVPKYMEEKEKVHPNRYDFCRMDGTVPRDEWAKNTELNTQPGTSMNPFGGASAHGNAFAKPAFGSTPFGQTPKAFGQPAQSSGFGQTAAPSAFGQAAPVSAFGQPAQSSAFGQPAQTSAFGRPSQPSAFGQPGFGQSNTPGQPAFGQTGFGQGASGQTSSKFGGPIQNASPFGGASASATSAFGQTSALGQNAGSSNTPAASGFGAGNSFGQPAQPGAFGKPAFGSTAAPAAASPFGSGTTQNNNQSPFGSGTAQTNNASPFGNAAQTSTTGRGFGTAPSGSQPASGSPAPTNPFGQSQRQPAQTASPFGQSQPTSQPANPFGQAQQPQQSSPFGQVQQKSPFGQPPQQLTQQASPFGQPQQPQQPQQASNAQTPFGQQTQGAFGTQSQPVAPGNQAASNPFGSSAQQNAPAQQQQTQTSTVQASKPTDKPVRPLHYTQTLPPGHIQTGLNGKLSLYRNQPVRIVETYRPSADGVEVKDTEYPVYNRPDGKGTERIWFPNGLQEPSVQKLRRVIHDFQDLDDAYDAKLKEQYAYLFEHGGFKDHIVPLVPPEREWIDYDF